MQGIQPDPDETYVIINGDGIRKTEQTVRDVEKLLKSLGLDEGSIDSSVSVLLRQKILTVDSYTIYLEV